MCVWMWVGARSQQPVLTFVRFYDREYSQTYSVISPWPWSLSFSAVLVLREDPENELQDFVILYNKDNISKAYALYVMLVMLSRLISYVHSLALCNGCIVTTNHALYHFIRVAAITDYQCGLFTSNQRVSDGVLVLLSFLLEASFPKSLIARITTVHFLSVHTFLSGVSIY